MSDKPSLLIISFTDINADARVRKQVTLFSETFNVVTCGYGEQVRDDIEHVRLSPRKNTLARYFEPLFVRAKAYRQAFWSETRAKAAAQLLRGRNFDAVLANELETLPVAYRLVKPAKVLLDLHEFYPGLRDDLPLWVSVRKPYQEWILRNQAIRTQACTTVSETIANRYRTEYGIECGVVWNASAYSPQLHPTEVTRPIRMVHSGVAAANRHIEIMVKAVARAKSDVTLDLYLTQQDTAYGRELQEFCARMGGRITLHQPVPHAELVSTLNQYDLGLQVIAPSTTNNHLALPNKFFDSVQARLGMLIAPSPDMVALLERYDLGAVADGFDEASVIAAIDALTVEDVRRWKQHAQDASFMLSAEEQNQGWIEAMDRVVVG